MAHYVDGLPIFSTSEELSFKNCRLGHHFEYGLGYRPVFTNRKLSVGIGVHVGLEAYYLDNPIQQAIDQWVDERWEEIVAAGLQDDDLTKLTYSQDRDLVVALVDGYAGWVTEEGLDDGHEVVEIEQTHYIHLPGWEWVLPIKLDLLQRNTYTGRLRVVDFKTRDKFYTDTASYQLSEQNGNYQLGVFAVYEERPSELQYRELRKVIPNNRTKPPYFRAIPIRLTQEEMVTRLNEYETTAKERFNPDRVIYSNPSACCGSWKNDWQAPCLLVHQGYQPESAIDSLPRYAKKSPYDRYQEDLDQ